ncbi:MAG: inorganic pyrophosphatase [Candidatus Zambryskibacteria bacterium RIFCSPHIGHO2_01_FULL_43_27]|uniref:Inorganic pyrophosphatase n=1 Tax=Candidatus Zambryskibacteria bacterium RIFCSPLOWO2_01_FULL_43_17 TaxID=1802760 RepID=A0A1G2U575_9BACT|nr:MAG: inorganic pyrophosphatase [Candidatus Zambryskibacteria bacterium RIFCSPHIGHO2_01_FULL_43_27]OHB00108.1 MAG: inorganic pyrophosphatase [Candidatus Zambryskibacteria bacterium RIFCSPHIGHO2_12_FULL_43_12b]OHB04639.1 MAG: inorganic pyrophosphatase [Candidatus Zambryskibacteria bacterium RIFCSPLOWO2_01_FULL_43_17]
MHYWHDIEPGTPEEINVIVEIAKGSKNKYEIDKKTGLIALDRVAHTAQDFPFDYGFVPQTLWHDNDPVDVVILSTHAFSPGVLVRVRPVAIMNMIDSGEKDDKIISVPTEDPRWKEVKDLEDINKHTLKEIEHFYSTYKKLQDKEVSVTGFKGAKEAKECFNQGIALYKEKFSK